MGFSKLGQNYRVYYIVHLLIPEEGYVDQYYFEQPSTDTMRDDIILKKAWLQPYKAKIQILNIEPLLNKGSNG